MANNILLSFDVATSYIVVNLVASLPGSPTLGDYYFVTAGGDINKVCYCFNDDPLTWKKRLLDASDKGVLIYDQTGAVMYQWTGAGLEVFTAGGSGDVVGPASAIDGNLSAFDTTTGKLIKDSGKALTDVHAQNNDNDLDPTFEATFEKVANKDAVSGYAGLDASQKVIKDPANATATPTASKIPVADGSAKLDGWVSGDKHNQYTDIAFGLDANKGTAVVGKVYFATDTGTFYEGIV